MTKVDQYHEERLSQVEDAFRVLNKEMGTVQGELRWIRLLMGATVLLQIANLFRGG